MSPYAREVLGKTNPRTCEREKSKSNMTAFLVVLLHRSVSKALSRLDPNDPRPATIPKIMYQTMSFGISDSASAVTSSHLN